MTDDDDLVARLRRENRALRDRIERITDHAEELAARLHDAEHARDAQAARLARIDASPVFRLGRAVRAAAGRTAAGRTAGRTGSRDGAPGPSTAAFDAAACPVLVVVRDRLTPLEALLGWLDRAGHRNVTLVDNGSTYPPMVGFLRSTSLPVVRCPENLGHRAPWLLGLVQALPGWFVVTDPDVVPDETCPLDAIAHLHDVALRHPEVSKVGLGLRVDDLPEHFAQRDAVRRWEDQYWQDQVEPGVFRGEIDTTFALYRPGSRVHRLDALRTGAPYCARHLPWYADSSRPTDEDRYYRDHLDPAVNNWDQGADPDWKHQLLPPA